MEKKSYADLLKDPRWQKKRLEIMQRDGFSCQECGDDKTTLNVHHLIYYQNKIPWEYDGNELRTLCECCHQTMYDDFQTIKSIASEFDGETLHYAVDILAKMDLLNPDDCAVILRVATELVKLHTNKNYGKKVH